MLRWQLRTNSAAGSWLPVTLLMVALLMGTLADGPAQAQDGTPGNDSLRAGWLPQERFFPAQPRTPGLQRLLNRRDPELKSFQDRTGVTAWALWNESTRRPRLVLLDGAPMATGLILGDQLQSLARQVLSDASSLIGVDPSTLVFERQKAIGPLRLVQFRQRLGTIPVQPSLLAVTFFQRPAELVLVRIDAEACLASEADSLMLNPQLTQAHALQVASTWVGDSRVRSTTTPTLVVAPAARADGKGVEPRLAYRLELLADTPRARYRVAIDAITGQVIAAEDLVRYVDLVGNVAGLASPGLVPDTGANPPAPHPLAGLTVTAPGLAPAITDTAGDFVLVNPGTTPVPVTLQLLGPYVNVNNVTGGELVVTSSLTPGVVVPFLLNAGADPLTTAQVNGFIQTNVVHAFLKGIDPTWTDLDFPIACNCNINDTCNAYYDNDSINFYQAGNGCVNTSYSSVIHHEYGHGVLDHLVPFAAGSYHEGFADITATLLNNDPRVGIGLNGGAYLRNVDLQDREYPQDAANPIHDAGLIIGGAFWDTRTALIASMGAAAGLDHARQLYFHHAAFQSGTIDPLLTIDVLMVDDDDGSLMNGTPHYAEIQQGFGAHGLDAPALPTFAFTHVPLASTKNDTYQHTVRAQVVGLMGPVASVEVYHRSAPAGPFASSDLVSTGRPDEYLGLLPPMGSTGRREYYLRADALLGNVGWYPEGAPATTLGYFVGAVDVVFADTVVGGPNNNGWSSTQVTGQDDWQRERPNQRAPQYVNVWDPLAAHSSPNVWGNDLAPPNFNGDYQNNVSNYLQSAPIDCSGRSGMWIEYWRWLTVEQGIYDQAELRVAGTLVFANDPNVDHIDSAWAQVAIDVAALADNNPAVPLRYSLVSDGGVTFGGWNIDDIRLLSVTPATDPVFAYQLPDVAVAPGGVATVPITLRNDLPVASFSVAGFVHPALVTVQDVTLTGTQTVSLGPDFFAPQLGTGFFGADVILDFNQATVLPASAGQQILRVHLEVAASATVGTVLPLAFEDGSGFPVLLNRLTPAGGGITLPFLIPGSLVVVPFTSTPFLRGDVNDDGAINLPDVILSLQHLFIPGSPAPPCLDALDINDDGSVNLSDPTLLLGYIFQNGAAPLPPWPQEGTDPTPDPLGDC